MGLRRGHCYSRVKRGDTEGLQRAYTRKSKFKKKSFIKSVPTNKITRYHMGDLKAGFEYRISLITKQPVVLRHNALESSRLVINRRLEKTVGNSYHFIIRVYPHQILRENRMLTGAGADRMQTGMQQAFGTAIGIAAQVKKSQSVFSIDVNKEHVMQATDAIRLGIHRLPGKYTILKEKL